MKIYDTLLTIFKPLIIWWGGLHAPFSHKKITGSHYYKWRDIIEPGMVFLTKTDGELSNIINPTDLKHGAIYVGNLGSGKVHYVLEAVGRGVVLTDLVTFLTTKDIVVGMMPNFIRDKASFDYELHDIARRTKGIPYDFLFNQDGKAFYCFELVAYCLKSVYPEVQLKEKEIVKGKRIYNEETFLDSYFFKPVIDSRKE